MAISETKQTFETCTGFLHADVVSVAQSRVSLMACTCLNLALNLSSQAAVYIQLTLHINETFAPTTCQWNLTIQCLYHSGLTVI